MFIIEDGTGKGYKAQVDMENRLRVRSTSVPDDRHELLEGNATLFSTGAINLTSASESNVFYLKNDSSTDVMVLSGIFVFIGASDATATDTQIKIYGNPTSVSYSTAVTGYNPLLGEGNTISNTCYKGAEAATQTGGTLIFNNVGQTKGFCPCLGNNPIFAIQPGKDIAIGIIPPTANTDMDVSIIVNTFVEGGVS